MSNVLVVTHCDPKGLPQQGSIIADHLRQRGVRVHVLGKSKSGWGRLLEITAFGLLTIPRCEIVLVDVFGLRAFVYESVAILWARVWKRRVIGYLHNGSMPQFVKRWQSWACFILSRLTVTVVPHEYLKEHLSDLGVRIDRIIPNFINLDNYEFRERKHLEPKCLYLRGMHRFYNAPMAIQVFALIQQRYPNAALTIAGKEGADSDYCRLLVRDLKLSNVKFLGIVPKKEISRLADKHDIYLNTSRVDNMPVTVIEMWACGVPIVGTRVGGVPYLIRNGEDGLLVESENCDQMANACLELLSNSALAGRLSRNGRLRAETFTWKRVEPLWESILNLDVNTVR